MRNSEMVERSFAHVLDRGGMRRAWRVGVRMSTNARCRASISHPDARRIRHAREAPFVIQFDAPIAIVANIEGKPALVIIVAPETD